MTPTLSISHPAAAGDPLSRHLKAVAAIRPYMAPPEQWDALVARLDDFRD